MIPATLRRPCAAAVTLVAAWLAGGRAGAAPYVWPLSGTTTQDQMNTSFGPRENYSMWDFHDGIDLPAALGTTCYAVADGTVFRAGPAGTDSYSSRHVVLRVVDPSGTVLFVNYIHLSAIEPGIVPGATVLQGARVGYVGHDDATYDHLHFEIRQNSNWESDSVHPLHWMPYVDTPNFSFEAGARFNRTGPLAGRLRFGAGSKEEGDLKHVEVDLMNLGTVLATRVVDFDDKATIQEGPGDASEFVDDIAVEGYQSSNMGLAGYPDLSYGVVVRDLPGNCTGLVARATDIGGNLAWASFPVSQTQTEFYETLPAAAAVSAPWTALASTSGTGTTVYLGPTGLTPPCGNAAALPPALICADHSTGGGFQQACVSINLPPGRFEWTAEGYFYPAALTLAPADVAYLLEFTSGANPSVAALLYKPGADLYATLAARNPDGTYSGTSSSAYVSAGEWRHWRLEVLRVGTRESTAVLYLDQIERARMSWSSSVFEPDALRAGLGLISPGATATVYADLIHVTEAHHPGFPYLLPCGGSAPPACATCPPADSGGDPLAVVVLDYPVVGRTEPPWVTFSKLPADAVIGVYTPSGRLVRHLDGPVAAGALRWRLDDAGGRPVTRGVYLALVRSGSHRRYLKLVLRR